MCVRRAGRSGEFCARWDAVCEMGDEVGWYIPSVVPRIWAMAFALESNYYISYTIFPQIYLILSNISSNKLESTNPSSTHNSNVPMISSCESCDGATLTADALLEELAP